MSFAVVRLNTKCNKFAPATSTGGAVLKIILVLAILVFLKF